MKDIKLNGQTYNGIKEVELPTTNGTALFKDVDEITTSSGGLEFKETRYVVGTDFKTDQYWYASNTWNNGAKETSFKSHHDFGIMCTDFEGTHQKEGSQNGVQSILIVYTPKQIRVASNGYRSNFGEQALNVTSCQRTSSLTNLKTDMEKVVKGNINNSYIPKTATACVVKEAELTKEQADVLMLALSGSEGYEVV